MADRRHDARPTSPSTSADGPSLTVAAVARRLGVAPATLRTWDRRYGLGPSEHLAGSHRRYSAADLGRLLVMRRLTLEGVAPSEAARTALATPDPAEPDVVGPPGHGQVIDAFSDAAPMAPDPSALAVAAAHFDNGAVRWMLARVHPRDTLAWWKDLVEPALRELAARSQLQRPGEAVAPALTAAAFAELRSRGAVAAAHSRSQGTPREVRTTTPADDRAGPVPDQDSSPLVLVVPGGTGPTLVVHVMATALQSRGVDARVLVGGRDESVTATVEELRPAAVLLESGPDDDGSGVAAILRSVVAADDDLPVFVHRAGSAAVTVPASPMVHRVRTLTGALHEILAVVG